MEPLYLATLIAIDVMLLIGLAYWAARGGTGRVIFGLILSAAFGVLVGVPIFAVATLLWRRRLTSSAAPSRAAATHPGRG